MVAELTDIKRAVIVENIAGGTPITLTCELAGISTGVFYYWLKRGREGDERYTDFLRTVNRAKTLRWLDDDTLEFRIRLKQLTEPGGECEQTG